VQFATSTFRSIHLGLAISIALFWCGLAQAQTTCFGIPDSDTANVCSGHGTCVAPDTCVCDDPNVYTGLECELPVCNGFSSEHASACSGQGVCIAPDTCACTAGFTGTFCEQPVCNGLSGADAGVCSGQGSCVAPDTCACYDTAVYTGSDCELPVCNFLSSTDPSVCSGHGVCVAPDSCACDVGYTGTFCELDAIGVPVLSAWGLLVFALLLIATGLVMLNRRGSRPRPSVESGPGR
jgi:Notch-like protein